MLRLLLADDEAIVRAGIGLLLGGEPGFEIVGEVDRGDDAASAALALLPDVVVMDVRMPGVDGVEATRRIVEATGHRDRPVRVLVLTTFDADEPVFAALQAGASGFLLKHAAPTSLVAAVRAVAAGDAWLDPAVTRGMITAFLSGPARRPTPAQGFRGLTAREGEVLRLVAHGLSNAEIAARLVVAETTVKTHVGRVFDKLGARDRAQAVGLAYRHLLVLPDEVPGARPGS